MHAPPQKNHVTDGIPISPHLSYLLELQQALPEEQTLPQTSLSSTLSSMLLQTGRKSVLKDLFPDVHVPLV